MEEKHFVVINHDCEELVKLLSSTIQTMKRKRVAKCRAVK